MVVKKETHFAIGVHGFKTVFSFEYPESVKESDFKKFAVVYLSKYRVQIEKCQAKLSRKEKTVDQEC